jgi:hypothetical protein
MELMKEIQTGRIDSEFLCELEDVPLGDRTKALQPHLLAFMDGVAFPFVRALLRQLKACFVESASIQLLSALERITVPALVMSLPTEFKRNKSKVDKSKGVHDPRAKKVSRPCP